VSAAEGGALGPVVPPVTQLRARSGLIDLAGADEAAAWTIRVQLMHAWDMVRVRVLPSEPLIGVKVRALDALDPAADFHEDFVVKHRGVEVLREDATLSDAGVVNGATLLMMHRRRRPTREG
jgi:hypothetical protein